MTPIIDQVLKPPRDYHQQALAATLYSQQEQAAQFKADGDHARAQAWKQMCIGSLNFARQLNVCPLEGLKKIHEWVVSPDFYTPIPECWEEDEKKKAEPVKPETKPAAKEMEVDF